MDIDQQLQTNGHARVVVVLKPTRRHRVDGHLRVALDETISMQQEVARKLQRAFRPFKQSRTATLARETMAAASFSLRGAMGTLAAAHCDRPVYSTDPNAAAVEENEGLRYFPNLGVMFGTVDRQGLETLRGQESDVAALFAPSEMSLIRPVEVSALAGPDPGISWPLRRLGIPKLWDKGLTGEGVLIGHLDTGVDTSHPALEDQVDAFAVFDEIGANASAQAIVDTGIHGTHTAGLLVGKPFEGVQFGTAPGARLASATVIEHGDVPARVLAGLDWCVGQGVRLINLSLGIRQEEPNFSVLMKVLRMRDILPVVAIGNDGVDSSRSPGNLPESLSVGACDEADQIWFASSSATMPESPKRIVPLCIGPGVSVWSSVPNRGLRGLSGTSMATPHITGLAALLLQHRPEATANELQKAIIASCKRPGGISTLRGNKGIPDALTALEALQG